MFIRQLCSPEAESPASAPPKPAEEITFEWGVKIPTRDGIQLNATIYRPKEPAPVPAIFTLSPYIADSYHPRANFFARHGYAFVLVDCRGRGNSGGEFEPFVNEGRDGCDIVEWLATQAWCDGQVTMWGGSYGGFDQWMTLKEFPAPLKTLVPVASAHAGVDFPFFKNIFYSYEMQWLTLVSGRTGNANLFAEQSFWIEKFQELFKSGRPYKELDQIVGNLSTCFQTWMAHPTQDAYWQQMWLSPAEYALIEQPILTITGHYDGDQPGALHYYQEHMRHGTEEAKARHYLIIGPWDHGGTRTPNQEFGGLKFGEAVMVDMNKLHREWYDWTMKGGEKPEFLKDRVAYYLMGAEEWKYAPSLEGIQSQPVRLYLASQAGQANDVFHSGMMLDQPPEESPSDQYLYDPLDLRIAELEQEDVKAYLTDQRYDLNLFGQGLVYHSAPFEEPTEITGKVRLEVWLSLDQADTDFQAYLSLIKADGSYISLTNDLLRARYRESLMEEKLVIAGEIEPYVFDGFTFFSYLAPKGSRLRLVLRAVNSIFVQKNHNTGGVVADENASQARPVQVTLYHDPEHPSCLELPVVSVPKV